MRTVLILLVSGIALIATLAGFLLWRDLAKERDAIAAQWTVVDAALHERAALAPRLIDAVHNHPRVSPAIVTPLAQAREALLKARTPEQNIEANGQLDSAFAAVLAATANIPALRSNESFPIIRDELAAADFRIAEERRKYNEALQRYNTSIELFPNNVVASLGGLKRNRAYFRAE